MNVPLPRNEPERLNWLRQSGVLDTPAEEAFDDITRLAAQVCGVPIAAVSLVDAERQWFKSITGIAVTETPRDLAFCAHTILQPETMIVPDTTQDDRFRDNPFVTGNPDIRFYAGAPLVTSDGFALGSLCVLDTAPRLLTEQQRAVLEVLARQVAGRIELQRSVALQERLIAERGRAEEAVRQSDEELRAVVDQAMDGIFLFDPHTKRLLKTNAALRTMLGYSEEQAAALTLYDIVAHVKTSIDSNVAELVREGEITLGERQYLRRDGSVIIAEVSGRVVQHDGDEAFCVVVHDLTEHRLEEEARLSAQEDYRALFENAAEGIFQTSPDGRYLRTNPALARIYGYDSPEQLLAELTDIGDQLYVDTGQRAEFQRLMLEQGRVTGFEAQIYRRDGTVAWISESARPVYDAAGGLLRYEGFVKDITGSKQAEAQREQELREALEQADRDPLTDLWNHRAFHRKLEEETARAQREGTVLAVVMLDLDNFKFFNDVYGHILGDSVLQQVAQRLRAVCRSYDTAARFGGDEFALLLPGFGLSTASQVETRLRAKMSGLSFSPDEQETAIPITVSLGAALLSDLGMDRQAALQQADERLRRAKTGGAVETEADRVRASALLHVGGFSMLDALVTAVDNKDRYTRKHSEDVMSYSMMIAQGLGLDKASQHTVAVSALLHDVGKIGVPDAILRKPGTLTSEEFEAIKQHPQMGAAIVSTVPGLEDTLDAVRHHHERWDGGGYPLGLRGEETPLIARLMAVADAFSAMTTDRPYRNGMSREKALSILEAGAGTQWDPHCVEAFLKAQARPETMKVAA
jgi:diguanylate cyclase (GGDEF)-like protein/PAS domain S-box-containing protein